MYEINKVQKEKRLNMPTFSLKLIRVNPGDYLIFSSVCSGKLNSVIFFKKPQEL